MPPAGPVPAVASSVVELPRGGSLAVGWRRRRRRSASACRGRNRHGGELSGSGGSGFGVGDGRRFTRFRRRNRRVRCRQRRTGSSRGVDVGCGESGSGHVGRSENRRLRRRSVNGRFGHGSGDVEQRARLLEHRHAGRSVSGEAGGTPGGRLPGRRQRRGGILLNHLVRQRVELLGELLLLLAGSSTFCTVELSATSLSCACCHWPWSISCCTWGSSADASDDLVVAGHLLLAEQRRSACRRGVAGARAVHRRTEPAEAQHGRGDRTH